MTVIVLIAGPHIHAQTIVPTLPANQIPEEGISHAPSEKYRYFEIQAVDTMKYSRDRARNPHNEIDIPTLVQRVAQLHATHIAIGTPYDPEFLPVLREWVREARKYNLSVWYRGNWSGFEGWFGYPLLSGPEQHHTLTSQFIRDNPDLFEEGDIFTPAPEPENGIIGDPRTSPVVQRNFNQWLINSYETCYQAMQDVGSLAKCGYFSTNGDVAHFIDKTTYTKIGNNIVIDHFVDSVKRFEDDIRALNNKYDLPVVLGEIGAPIPDIHGTMSPFEQAYAIKQQLAVLTRLQQEGIVAGVNYWTAFDGPTSLHSSIEDGMQLKHVGKIVRRYYKPIHITGQVMDQSGFPLSGAAIQIDQMSTQSDDNGIYHINTTRDNLQMSVKKEGFRGADLSLDAFISFSGYESTTFAIQKDIILQRNPEATPVRSGLKKLWTTTTGFIGKFLIKERSE